MWIVESIREDIQYTHQIRLVSPAERLHEAIFCDISLLKSDLLRSSGTLFRYHIDIPD